MKSAFPGITNNSSIINRVCVSQPIFLKTFTMESLLANLQKHLECSICLNTYNELKTISCLHTFCYQCLENHARASQRQGKFRCPECQAQIDLPEGNRFDSLPTSFFHNSLLSLLAVRQSGDGSSITCGNCTMNSSDVHYCFDCAKFMCTVCLNAHKVMRMFRGHKLVPVNEFQAQDYDALLKRQPFCSQQYHESEIARFFCLSCQACVCQICIATDHQNHKVILRRIYTTLILGTALLNFDTRASNIGHGPLDFCRVKANFSARVPKNLGGPRPPQEVVSARLKRGPRAETRGILVLRVFALLTDHKSEGSGVENEFWGAKIL